MSEHLSTEPYKGVRDFYPADWARLSGVFSSLRHTLGSWGYEEYQASPMERAEIYESKTSEEIVNEQTYTFTDRGDRRVTLRPEMTPTLARMVSAKRRELAFPLRWFSIGNRFRYERPQKGRLREFYQTDVDLIGLPEGEADAEIISIAHAVFRSLGATDADFTIQLNSRTLLNVAMNALLFTADEQAAYLALMDRQKKMSTEEFAQKRAPFERDGIDPLALIEARTNLDVDGEYQKVLLLIQKLSARGITNVVFDPSTVRGFLYYTGIVFEVFDTNTENPRALGGGGRYDGLVSLFGGDPIPAVGFAIGDVTLLDFLATHNLLPENTSAPQIYIGTPSKEDIGGAVAFAATLRASGIRVFSNLTEKSLGDQIKDAVKRTIPFFIAYGSEEAAGKKVKIKELAKSAEKSIEKKKVAEYVKKYA